MTGKKLEVRYVLSAADGPGFFEGVSEGVEASFDL